MPGSRSRYHLLERVSTRPSPEVATGWRTRMRVCDTNIWRLSLSDPGVAAGAPSPFIASTRAEQTAQYSPDGKRIAFESERSGPTGIWVSDADGSNTEELFSRSGRVCSTPTWSPDGQHIAFYSNLEGNFDIYIIRASGGKPVRLTSDSADDVTRAGREMAIGSTLHRIGPVDGRCGKCRPKAGRKSR